MMYLTKLDINFLTGCKGLEILELSACWKRGNTAIDENKPTIQYFAHWIT